jgi:hypothetical protein
MGAHGSRVYDLCFLLCMLFVFFSCQSSGFLVVSYGECPALEIWNYSLECSQLALSRLLQVEPASSAVLRRANGEYCYIDGPSTYSHHIDEYRSIYECSVVMCMCRVCTSMIILGIPSD